MKFIRSVVRAALGTVALVPALSAAALGLVTSAAPVMAQESSTACIGQLMLFGGNFCPRGYVEANGQTIGIAQNTALFSIYGTMYGGNGTQTFGVPDLRGRAPIGQGEGPNLPNYTQGQLAGSPSTTIQQPNLPAYSPPVNAVSGPAQAGSPQGLFLSNASNPTYGSTNGTIPATMAPGMISPLGKGVPMATQSPIQAIRWCVATQGIFCSRP